MVNPESVNSDAGISVAQSGSGRPSQTWFRTEHESWNNKTQLQYEHSMNPPHANVALLTVFLSSEDVAG